MRVSKYTQLIQILPDRSGRQTYHELLIDLQRVK